jgi:hypothetical protein
VIELRAIKNKEKFSIERIDNYAQQISKHEKELIELKEG